MSLSKDLMRAINCPVCLHPPRKVPVHHCPNGHHVCSDCTAKIQACPMCRNPRMDSRSLLADSVIESISLPCKFKDLGCLAPDMPMAEREHHEQKTCDHREVECPDLKCRTKVSLSKILDHLKAEYKRDFTICSGTKCSLELGVSHKDFWDSDHICMGEDNFIVNCFRKPSDWHWWVYYLGTKEEAKKFKVQLDLENNIGDKTLSFVSSPISIDVPKSDVIDGGLDLVMPQSLISKFVGEDCLSYSTTIQMRNVPASGSSSSELPLPDLNATVQDLIATDQDMNGLEQDVNRIEQDVNRIEQDVNQMTQELNQMYQEQMRPDQKSCIVM